MAAKKTGGTVERRATAAAKRAAPPLLNVGARAAGAGVTAKLATLAPIAPLQAAMLTMAFGAAGLLMQTVAEAGIRRRQAALEDFFREIGRQLNAGESLDDVRAKLEWRLLNEPNAQEAIFSTVQRLINATSHEAALPLAQLAAVYFEKPTDDFFRGFAALLSEVTSAELIDLRRLLGELHRLLPQTLHSRMLLYPSPADAKRGLITVHVGWEDTEQKHPRNLTIPDFPTKRRLFRLMKSGDLGFDGTSGGFGGGGRAGADILEIQCAQVTRLLRYLK